MAHTRAADAGTGALALALCILSGTTTVIVAAKLFSLSWQHSVEHTEWREDWRVAPAGLELVEARVKGSGAGMEPPEGSVLREGWWVYRPRLPAQERIVLAASGATGDGWLFCANGQCRVLGAEASDPITLEACRDR